MERPLVLISSLLPNPTVVSLRRRKGLSQHFSGKSRSFTRVNDAKCAGDLEKLEIPEAKRRKYAGRHAEVLTFVSCGTASGFSRCGSSLGFTAGLAEK